MKLVIVLCLVALAYANNDAKISNYQFLINEDGSYDSTFDTSNGISANKNGIYNVRLRRSAYPANEPATGSFTNFGCTYSYVWEGETYTGTWTADENGFVTDGTPAADMRLKSCIHVVAD